TTESRVVGRRVASVEPRMTRTNPAIIGTVSVSRRTRTPRTAATAGLMYVMTVARTGPISSIRAANTRNAAAVQITARMTIEPMTLTEGRMAGSWSAAIG